MDVTIDWSMNIYVNNKLADMDTKVYENFSVIWTMEELQLSDVEVYEPEEKAEERVREDRPAGTAGFSALASKAAGSDELTGETGASGSGTAGDTVEVAAGDEPQDVEEKKKGARIVMGPGVKRAEEEAKAKARAREEEAARAKAEEEKRREELLNKHVPVSIIVTVNGEQIKLSGKKNYVFVDVFEYIDFDLSKPEGSGIVTNLNGRGAQYMESIKSGDNIEIYWKK